MAAQIKPKKQPINISYYKRNNYLKNRLYNHDLGKKTSPTPIKITETDASYHFEMVKPGYVKDDFNFYLNEDTLVVTTEKKSETHKNKDSKHSYCYPSAYFKNEFDLPNDIVTDEIVVDYKDGILSFELFKSKDLN